MKQKNVISSVLFLLITSALAVGLRNTATLSIIWTLESPDGSVLWLIPSTFIPNGDTTVFIYSHRCCLT